MYIANDGVVIQNLVIDTVTHNDNLIEIYSNATLKNVTVKNGKKAGIYVNNDKAATTITVNFENITTADNNWAGIGLVAQQADSKVIAKFTGKNAFGEAVGVYSDNNSDEYTGQYLGTVEVEGLKLTVNATDKKNNWK
ncbi:hypothetical protein [Sporosarcina sp. NPDC096371]|uniref:hypothetical protein n=1 Tax=Sporosarcina sp. NPDC096371 TaxID=3364530 RepID=UPI0037F43453